MMLTGLLVQLHVDLLLVIVPFLLAAASLGQSRNKQRYRFYETLASTAAELTILPYFLKSILNFLLIFYLMLHFFNLFYSFFYCLK